jgi:hypothetical protein
MPRQGYIDNEYTTKLQSIGIELVDPFKGTKIHHQMQCCICSHVWSATPLSKIQAHKNRGQNGCPKCNIANKYDRKRLLFLQKIKDRGFILLTQNYDGNQHQTEKITVTNTICNHTFDILPRNIISRNVNCPICNKEQKIQTLNNSSHKRSEEWQKTASDWKIYKSNVSELTRLNYKLHQQQINPHNLLRGVAGTEGAHHLDHIVPIRYCFENDIPVEICAHPDNLQLLGWRENVGSRDKLKEFVPQIFDEYIN